MYLDKWMNKGDTTKSMRCRYAFLVQGYVIGYSFLLDDTYLETICAWLR